MRDDRIKLIFIAGAGRSGSSLLERMLAQVPGIVPAGEVTHIWERGFIQDQLCGCGKPFSRCPFWGAVTAQVTKASPSVSPCSMLTLRKNICSLGRIPQLRFPALRTRDLQSKFRIYRSRLLGIYEAIRDVTGCEWIVDSSKYPPEAYLLSSIADIDLFMIHLVRNSKAVVYSWKRQKLRPEIHWTQAYMPRYPVVKTALAWNVYNILLDSLRRDVRSSLIRYEDLIADPCRTLVGLTGELGIDADLDGFIDGRKVELSTHHTVSGNPVRFERGEVELRQDREWESDSPRLQKLLVDFLTFPLQRRYGYALGSETSPKLDGQALA